MKKRHYEVIGTLNNNGVIAKNDLNQEVILLGKGIGFKRKAGDVIENPGRNIKSYSLDKNNSAKNILQDVDPIFLEIANEIIRYAEKEFGDIDTHILLPLADHIAFSIDRIKNNMVISNPLTSDIKLLFADEYEVAKKARKIIKRRLGYEITDDEIGYISLHIHAALSSQPPARSLQVASIIHQTVTYVEESFHIQIDENSVAYIRLVNHIKFLMVRLDRKEDVNVSMTDYTKERFPDSYAVACKVADYIEKLIHEKISEDEIGYLAIHVERIRNSV